MIDLLSTFLLGIAIIVHPCTAAPNLAAMTYIGSRSRRHLEMWMYVLGHTLLYILLGTVLIALLHQGIGAEAFQKVTSTLGHTVLVVVFLIAGIMFVASSLGANHHHHQQDTKSTVEASIGKPWKAFLSGMLIALAFCPEAALAYFGVMMPLAVTSPSGVAIPIAFAIGTLLPLAIVAECIINGKQLKFISSALATRHFNLAVGILFILSAIIAWYW